MSEGNDADATDPAALADEVGSRLDALTRQRFDELADRLEDTQRAIAELSSGLQIGRASQAEGDTRWEQRMAAIENRLIELDASLHTEIERVRGSASVLDLLADEFRSTMGDTRDLAGTTGEVNDRLRALLDNVGQINDAVHGLREQGSDTTGLDERLGEIANALQSATNRLGGIEAGGATQQEEVAEQRRALDALREAVDALGTATGQLDQRFDETRTQLRDLRQLTGDPAAVVDRLQLIVGRLDRTDEQSAQILATLDARAESDAGRSQALDDQLTAISADLVAIRQSLGGTEPRVIGEIHAGIGAVTESLAELHRRQPDLVGELGSVADRIEGAIGALRTQLGEAAGQDRSAITQALDEFRNAVGDPAQLLEPVSQAIDAVRAEQRETAEAVTQLGDRTETASRSSREALDERLASMDAARSEDARALTDAVAQLVSEGQASRQGLDELAGTIRSIDSGTSEIRQRVTEFIGLVERMSESLGSEVTHIAERAERIEVGAGRDRQSIETLTNISSAVESRIAELSAGVEELSRREPEVAGLLTPVTSELSRLQVQSSAAATQLEGLTESMAELGDVVPRLDRSTSSIDERIQTVASETEDLRAAVARLAPLVESVGQAGETVRTEVLGLAPLLEEQLGQHAAAVDTQLQDSVRAQERVLEGLRDDVASTLEGNRAVVDGLGAQLSSLHAAFTGGSTDASRIRSEMDGALEQLAERIGSALREIRAELHVGAADPNALRTSIEAGLDRLASRLDKDVGRILEAMEPRDGTDDRLRRIDASLTDMRRDLEVLRRLGDRAGVAGD